METTVALIIFNRPEETARVLAAIRQTRPARLLIVADGPRPYQPGEAERCASARAVIEQVDWECDVLKNYSETNLGCKQRVASGLDWIFDQCEEAIILEDDCLPCASFFPFCEALLERYRYDARVMHIGGNSFGLDERIFAGASYGFSSFPQVWGWATWRRAWSQYQLSMTAWPAFRDGGWMRGLPIKRSLLARQYQRWNDVHAGLIDTWDFQWHFAVMSQHGLAAIPQRNLISNIGFSTDATHTRDITSAKANVPFGDLEFPLAHPPFVSAHPALNEAFASKMLGDSVLGRISGNIQRHLRFLSVER